MAKVVYTLKKHPESKECHLFEGEMTQPNTCSNHQKSICKKMDTVDPSNNIFACKDEEYARRESAKIGRDVCGTCISHLYASYP